MHLARLIRAQPKQLNIGLIGCFCDLDIVSVRTVEEFNLDIVERVRLRLALDSYGVVVTRLKVVVSQVVLNGEDGGVSDAVPRDRAVAIRDELHDAFREHQRGVSNLREHLQPLVSRLLFGESGADKKPVGYAVRRVLRKAAQRKPRRCAVVHVAEEVLHHDARVAVTDRAVKPERTVHLHGVVGQAVATAELVRAPR